MCATIAAMAVQITKTQIATAMAAEISDIVSSFTFMILLDRAVRGWAELRTGRSAAREMHVDDDIGLLRQLRAGAPLD